MKATSLGLAGLLFTLACGSTERDAEDDLAGVRADDQGRDYVTFRPGPTDEKRAACTRRADAEFLDEIYVIESCRLEQFERALDELEACPAAVSALATANRPCRDMTQEAYDVVEAAYKACAEE
jgi:hypothetical protein